MTFATTSSLIHCIINESGVSIERFSFASTLNLWKITARSRISFLFFENCRLNEPNFCMGVSFQLYVHYIQPLSSPQDNTYPIYYICPLIFFDSFKLLRKKTLVRDVVKRLILYNMRKIQRLQISVRTSIFFLPHMSCTKENV